MAVISNELLKCWAIFVVVNDIAACYGSLSSPKTLTSFSEPCLVEEFDLLGYELGCQLSQVAEHLQVHGVIEIKHHAISRDEQAIMLFAFICKDIILHACLIPKESGDLVDQHYLNFI